MSLVGLTAPVEYLKNRVLIVSNSGATYPLGAPGLALELGIDDRVLRAWLRAKYPERAPGKGGEWKITIEMVIAAARQF